MQNMESFRLTVEGLFFTPVINEFCPMAKNGINIATSSLQQEEMIVGIDLGTTNSLVAIIHPGTRLPVVLKEQDGTALVPSIIHFGNSGMITVGDEARQWLISEPQNTVFSVKRLMGKSYND